MEMFRSNEEELDVVIKMLKSVNLFELLAQDDDADDNKNGAAVKINKKKKQQPSGPSVYKQKAISENTAAKKAKNKKKKKPSVAASQARTNTTAWTPVVKKPHQQQPAANGRGPALKQNGAMDSNRYCAYSGGSSRNQSGVARQGAGNYNGGCHAAMMRKQQHPSASGTRVVAADDAVEQPEPVPLIPTLPTLGEFLGNWTKQRGGARGAKATNGRRQAST